MKVLSPKQSLLCMAACFGLPMAIQAAPIIGTMQVTGVVDVGASFVDFLPVGGGTGQLGILGAGNSGTFAVYNLANPAETTTITVKDLSGGPATGPVSILNFITFGTTALAGDALNLTSISGGSGGTAGCGAPAAVGDTCTPLNSPFTLTDVADASAGVVPAGTPCAEGPTPAAGSVNCATAITFLFAGNAVATDGSTSSLTGTLSTQTTAGVSTPTGTGAHTYQDILAFLAASPTNAIEESFSGVISTSALATTVPEPNFGVVLAGGLILIGLGTMRRRRRAVD